MEATLRDLRRWIDRHYAGAPKAVVMRQILSTYAAPMVAAFGAILAMLQTSASEWMVHDVKELYKSLRVPWQIVDPPPRLPPPSASFCRAPLRVRGGLT